MGYGRRQVLLGLAIAAVLPRFSGAARAATATDPSVEILDTWYRLILELVRHTPTYSPPVASRSFAYIGIAAYEAVASGKSNMRSLAGQGNGLSPLPALPAGQTCAEPVLLNATLAAWSRALLEYRADRPARACGGDAQADGTGRRGRPARGRGLQRGSGEGNRGSHSGLGRVGWRRSDREHGLPADLHARCQPRRLGADQQDRPATGPAPARVGQQPHHRHADGATCGLPPARL